jgi:hypothetical protein
MGFGQGVDLKMRCDCISIFQNHLRGPSCVEGPRGFADILSNYKQAAVSMCAHSIRIVALSVSLLVVAVPNSTSAARTPKRPPMVNFSSAQISDQMGHRWDVARDGQITDGTNDCFDGACRLMINNSQFSPAQATKSADSTYYQMSANLNQIHITRNLWIDQKRGAVRYHEVFRNLSKSTQQVRVVLNTRFGGSARSFVTNTGQTFNGGALGKKQIGITSISAGSRPCVLLVLGSPKTSTGLIKPSIVVTSRRYAISTYTFSLKKGQTVSIVHWVAQRRVNTVTAANVGKLYEVFYKNRLLEYNLLPTERKTVANFRLRSSSVIGSTSKLLHRVNELADEFDVDRKSGATLIIDEDTKITGQLVGKTFKIKTAAGLAEVPIENIAMMMGGGGRGRAIRLYLRNGEVLVGDTEAEGLALQSGPSLKVPLDPTKIYMLFTKFVATEGKAPKGTVAFVQTEDGNRLALGPEAEKLTLHAANAWGALNVPLKSVRHLQYVREPQPGHWLTLDDYTRVRVFLLGQPIQISTERFGNLTIEPRSIARLDSTAPLDPPPSGRFLLIGENQISGVLADEQLNIITASGLIPVPSAQIKSIERHSNDGGRPAFSFQMQDENTIVGQFERGTLHIKTRYGQWRIPDRHFEEAMGLGKTLTASPAAAKAFKDLPPAMRQLANQLQSNPKDHDAATKLSAYYLIEKTDAKTAMAYATTSKNATLLEAIKVAGRPAKELNEAQLFAVGQVYFNHHALATTAKSKASTKQMAILCLDLFLKTHKTRDLKSVKVQLLLRSLKEENSK